MWGMYLMKHQMRGRRQDPDAGCTQTRMIIQFGCVKNIFQKSSSERMESAKTNIACFRCLQTGHLARRCRRNFICKEIGCGKHHHTLLCEGHQSGTSCHVKNQVKHVLMQLQTIKAQACYGNKMDVNTLWDNGSSLSFITFKKAAAMKLRRGRQLRLEIEKVGGEITEIDSCEYQLHLVDKNEDEVELTVLGIEKISSDISGVSSNELVKIFPQT
jgi:hypothetical protein